MSHLHVVQPNEEPLAEWEREFLEVEAFAIELLGHAEYMRRLRAKQSAERRLVRSFYADVTERESVDLAPEFSHRR